MRGSIQESNDRGIAVLITESNGRHVPDVVSQNPDVQELMHGGGNE
jgi:hypothetical protein